MTLCSRRREVFSCIVSRLTGIEGVERLREFLCAG